MRRDSSSRFAPALSEETLPTTARLLRLRGVYIPQPETSFRPRMRSVGLPRDSLCLLCRDFRIFSALLADFECLGEEPQVATPVINVSIRLLILALDYFT